MPIRRFDSCIGVRERKNISALRRTCAEYKFCLRIPFVAGRLVGLLTATTRLEENVLGSPLGNLSRRPQWEEVRLLTFGKEPGIGVHKDSTLFSVELSLPERY